ncbi:MAG: hypothetical protein JXA16_04175, partial [Bacteroidales bacterium]|nr:hypothetical protein [Bacteroidales bacterium]
MKKFITSLLLFVIFFSIFYICALFLPSIFKPNLNYRLGAYGHMYTRLSEVKNVTNLDILFLGSSKSYRGIDTRIFKKNGFNTFNLGSSSQTPIQTKVLLKRYLTKLKPKLIIYEVYPLTFSIDGVESALDIISNEKNNFNSIKMAFELNHIVVYNTLLYSMIRNALNLNSSYIEPIKKGDDKYISGGFVEKEIKFFKHVEYPMKNWTFNETQFSEFNEIVDFINKQGIQLILVNAPVTPSLNNSYINNSDFDSIMSNYSKYYNFNKILNLNDSLYFYDSNHLNQYGVKLFNEKL